MITLTKAAQDNVDEAGIDPADDIAALRLGKETPEGLLSYCLEGADDDRVTGWREYVAAVVAAAWVSP